MATFKTYQDVLLHDAEPLPEALDLAPRDNPDDPVEVPVAYYTSRRYHELEKERIWSRVWQVACREEQIPEPGDQLVYDIVDKSYLIVRGPDGRVRAFVNACLHRGRALRDYDGNAHEIRCPFHAAAWDLDGAFKQIPCREEFGAFGDESWRLPEIAVDTWGGFVFVNPAPNPEPLSEFLGVLRSHFARWAPDKRYIATHVVKKLRCNWKIAQEAFMEAYHVPATHPQSTPGIGDCASQYDGFGMFSRAISPRGVSSPLLKQAPSEQTIIDTLVGRTSYEGAAEVRLTLPEGMTARQCFAELNRDRLRSSLGSLVDSWTTTELADYFYYTVFPNFHPWGSYSQIMYLFRPNGDDHRTCIMEFLVLASFEGERPKPAPRMHLDFDATWTDAVGPTGRIFDQDSLNMPQVQKGLETTRQTTIRLAERQEAKIRHFYRLYAEWLGEDFSPG